MKKFPIFFVCLFWFLIYSEQHLLFAQATEGDGYACNDGVDNDGDGLIDCADDDCQPAANLELDCNCEDGIDNDGDGQIDIEDGNCASYYGLSFMDGGETVSCSTTPEGTARGEIFDYMGPPNMTSQNTADTQTKVIVGDVDGDGLPDMVATSKWNKSIRVIASTAHTAFGVSYNAGDIKSTFRTPQDAPRAKYWDNGLGGQQEPNTKHTFELEVAIADIDGNGKAELYSIVSTRPGNQTNNPPTEFYLMGFTYTPNNPTPIFDPIYLGPERPGEIAITDFDGDGRAEVYLKNRIYAAESGVLLFDGGGSWDTEIAGSSVGIDLIPGGNQELVCGNFVYEIPSLSARTQVNAIAVHDMNDIGGATDFFVKTIADLQEYGSTTFSGTSVADIDADGDLDIFLTGATGGNFGVTTIFWWDFHGGTVKTYSPPDPVYANGWIWGTSRLNLGEVDGIAKWDNHPAVPDPGPDGDQYPLEITFIAGNQFFMVDVNDATGELEPLWIKTINDSRSGIVMNTVYDFNNDGYPEIVFRDAQQLVVMDGIDFNNNDGLPDVQWAVECQSHTMAEGPVIADVDGNGSTDICVACNTNNGFDINADIQQQALGQIRLYYSDENNWLPTRQVWNQPGYHVTNINDDLTVPTTQIDLNISFGTGPCANGIPGLIMPFNTFLNQVPSLGSDGCPSFPAPDVAFAGVNPDDPSYDSLVAAGYLPAITVIPPTCGGTEVGVAFNIVNSGSLIISSDMPVSFWEGNPTLSPDTLTGQDATLLGTDILTLSGLEVGDTIRTDTTWFNYSGTTSMLYVVLNDDGTEPIPISLTTNEFEECFIDNNIISIPMTPSPFTVQIQKNAENTVCDLSAPANGELQAVILENGVETTDYSKYGLQWYTGGDSTNAISAANGGNDIVLDSLFGDTDGEVYSLIATNLEKGCSSTLTRDTIFGLQTIPSYTIQVNSHQTVCSPPNGELEVIIAGGNTGFTIEWFDNLFNPTGITGPVASNLTEGEWIVRITSGDGCQEISSQTINGPIEPEATASTLQNIVDCADLNSGQVTAEAFIGGVLQDSANYTFTWYFADSVGNLGSTLPALHGTGPTRTGLPAGNYGVIITDDSTLCDSELPAYTEVLDLRAYPTVQIAELQPQRSCDPSFPNGVLQADVIDSTGAVVDPSNFTFEWYVGDNTLPENLHTITSGTNGQVADSVMGGGIYYTVKVINLNNCANTNNYIISEQLINPVLTLDSVPNSVCDTTLASTNYTGQVIASVTYDGSTVTLPDPNYELTWYAGTTTGGTLISVADPNNPVLPNLDGGYYTVVATRMDYICESAAVTIEVTEQQVLPTITTTVTPMTACDPALVNGAVSANVGGTTTGYTFEWFSGTDVTIIANRISTNATATGLDGTAGNNTYTVLVTNTTTGCQNSQSVTVPDNTVLPVVSLTSTPNSICDPAFATYNGSITASFTDVNGSNPRDYSQYSYTFLDSTGTDATVTYPGASVTDSTLNNIPEGSYSVIIVNDSLGCNSDPVNIVVGDTLILPDIITSITPMTACDTTLANGTATAQVNLNGTATTTGYSFEWFRGTSTSGTSLFTTNTADGLNGFTGVNTYTVEVVNQATGCLSTEAVTIADSSAIPTMTLATTPNGICDPTLTDPLTNYNGSITATVTDGNGGNGSPVSNFTDYTFTWVFDNGTDVVTTINGATANNSLLNNIPDSAYTVTVANNALGCISDPVNTTVTDNKVYPALDIQITSNTACVDSLSNGAAVALVDENGTLTTVGYSFTWFTGTDTTGNRLFSTNTATDLLGNSQYTVRTINLSSGCLDLEPITVSDISALPVVSLTTTPNTICDPLLTSPAVSFNGSVTATVTDTNGGNGSPVNNFTDYVFTWEFSNGSDVLTSINGSTATNNLLNNVPDSTYNVTVANTELGCVADVKTTTVADQTVIPVLGLDITANTACDDNLANGSAITTVTNLTGPFNFKYFAGADTSGATVSVIDTALNLMGSIGNNQYTVRVIDQTSGCLEIVPFIVPDSSTLPTMAFATTPNTICDPSLTDPSVNFDGSITATVNDPNGGGSPVIDFTDYVFTWTFENTDPVTTTNVPGMTDTDNILANIPDSSYTVKVENTVLGCISDPANVTVAEDKILPPVSVNVQAMTACDPSLANGIAVASVSDVGNYDYQWYEGTDTTTATGTKWNFISGTENEVAENLLGELNNNRYTVLVTNLGTGCINTQTIQVQDSSSLPILYVKNIEDNSICDPDLATAGSYNGSVAFGVLYKGDTVTNFSNYNFDWFNGSDTTAANFNDNLLIPELTELNAAFYTSVAYIDSLGCSSDPLTAEVEDITVLPSIVLNRKDQTSCTTFNGMAEAIVNGGADPSLFNYKWFVGTDTTAALADAGFGVIVEPDSAIQLPGNRNYTIRVLEEATGCINTKSGFLQESIVIPQVQTTMVSGLTVCDNPDGELLAQVTIGTQGPSQDGFTFHWMMGEESISSNVIANADSVQTDDGRITQLIPEFYTVVAVVDSTSCTSQPESIEVINETENIAIDINYIKKPSFCNDNDGEIGADPTYGPEGATSIFDFEWYNGGPTNDSVNFFTNPPQFTGGSLRNIFDEDADTLKNLIQGIYTVVVTHNTTGCKEYQTVDLPFINAHQITTAQDNSTLCPYDVGDGNLRIYTLSSTGADTLQTEFTYNVYQGQNSDPTNALTVTQPLTDSDSTKVFDLAPDFYTVEVINNVSNCPVYKVIEIDALARKPVVTLDGDLIANSACGISNSDGSISLFIAKHNEDSTAIGSYTAVLNPVSGAISPVSGTLDYDPNQDNISFNNLAPQAYEVTVTDDASSCQTVKQYTILDDPAIAEMVDGSVDIDSAIFCDPSGASEVISLNLLKGTAEDLRDYNFRYYSNADTTTAISAFTAGDPAADTGGDYLDELAPGNYYVVAHKLRDNFSLSGGIGCTTAPFQVQIDDVSEDPTIDLAANSNTSCDNLIFEGSIEYALADIYWDTLSYTGKPGDDYTVSISGPNGYSLTQPAKLDSIPDLEDGTYSFAVENNNTGCTVTKSITIIKNEQPIYIVDGESDPQLHCVNSGSAIVTAVSLNGTTTVPKTEFNFNWFSDASSQDTLKDGSNNTILVDEIDSLNYASIGAGTYFVEAIRGLGNPPGAGCRSAPFRIDIEDKSIDPVLDLTPTANTACDLTVADGQIAIAVTDTSGFYIGGFDYSWTSAPDADATDRTGVTVNESWADLQQGTYAVTVRNNDTGCDQTGTVSIPFNPIFPDIQDVQVNIIDQLLCDPSGSISITDVAPPDRDGLDTVDYNYQWTRSATYNTANALVDNDHVLDSVDYNSIGAGKYWLVIQKESAAPGVGAGCASSPRSFTILDKHINPIVDFNTTVSTACDITAADGSIEVIVTDTTWNSTTTGYNFSWAASSESDLDNRTNVSNNETWSDIQPGTFDVTVLNTATGCDATGQVTIVDNPIIPDIQEVQADIIDQLLCYNSGRITVTDVEPTVRDGADVGDYDYFWTSGTTFDSLNVVDNDFDLDSIDYTDIGEGIYWLKIQKLASATGPGAGCEAGPLDFRIIDRAIDPVLSFTTLSNTSCDTTVADGEIGVFVQDTSWTTGDYFYDWLTADNGELPAPDTITTGMNSNYTDLRPGTYSIQVTSIESGCPANGTVTVEDNPSIPVVQDSDIAILDQDLCDPSGSVTVNAMSPGVLADYTFEWRRGGDFDAATGVGDTQPVINNTTYDSIGAGTYWFLATKNTGTAGAGDGCQAAPVRVEIKDISKLPQLVLSATENTACDNSFDGSVTVTLSEVAGTPGVGSDYNLVWTSNPVDATVNNVNNINSPYTTTSPDTIAPGTYKLRIENNATGCLANGTITVQDNPQPIDIVDVQIQDQMICFDDGRIEVLVTNPVAVPDYTFRWYENEVVVGNELLDEDNGTVITGAELDSANFAGMGAGTYFVKAIKNSGNNPGSGCESAPFRADVDDLSEDPQANLTADSNTACDPLLANGSVAAVASERNGTTDTYDFTWSYNGGALPGTITRTDNSPTSDLANALDGDYTLTVLNTLTGCTIDAGIKLQIDSLASEPNIIDVDVVVPLDCNPSGSAEVTRMLIGGVTDVTDPIELANNYTYAWFEGEFIPSTQLGDTDNRIDNALAAGNYFVTVTSLETGCESEPKEFDVDDTSIIYPNIAIDQTVPQINCIGPPFGAELIATSVEEDGSTGPGYDFTWTFDEEQDGNYEGLPGYVPAPVTSGNQSTADELPVGLFKVITRNTTTNCTDSAVYVVIDESEKFLPQVRTGSEPLTMCTSPNGVVFAQTISINGYPYTEDYTFDWYVGTNPDTAQAADYPNADRLDILPEGTYTVVVTDNNTGCITIESNNINDERQYPDVNILLDNPVTNCDATRPNGQLTAHVNNGQRVSDFYFRWFDAPDTINTSTYFSDKHRVSGLDAGPYTVAVERIISGCISVAGEEILFDPLEVPLPTPEVVAPQTSCIDPNGSLRTSVDGQTVGYDFDWYDEGANNSFSDLIIVKNLPSADYEVTATDLETGCTSDRVPINLPEELVFADFEFRLRPSACEFATGAIEVTMVNDAQVRNMIWTDEFGFEVGQGAGIYDIFAGIYTVTVTTFEGCETVRQANLPTEILDFNLVTPNGNSQNTYFHVDCISNFPGNNVKIFNRNGVLVYEADNYDNVTVKFTGEGVNGMYLLGEDLPDGTYFYIIDKRDGSKPIAGYLELVR
ncbi:MAG: gliding motility-associated C-terminal domain-containing protein [Candidatus Cyclobacteriaceae bacterium M2_1C_046]